MEGCEPVGKLQARGKEIDAYDEVFGMQLRYFESAVQFVQKIKFTKPDYSVDAYLEYGACNDQSCLPPMECKIVESGKSPMAKSDNSGENKPQEEGNDRVNGNDNDNGNNNV